MLETIQMESTRELDDEQTKTLHEYIVLVEETLEMTGIVLLIYALLLHIADSWKEMNLEISLTESDPRQ